jgi:hypothetical protein
MPKNVIPDDVIDLKLTTFLCDELEATFIPQIGTSRRIHEFITRLVSTAPLGIKRSAARRPLITHQHLTKRQRVRRNRRSDAIIQFYESLDTPLRRRRKNESDLQREVRDLEAMLARRELAIRAGVILRSDDLTVWLPIEDRLTAARSELAVSAKH